MTDYTTYRTTGPSISWNEGGIENLGLFPKKILSTWTKSGVGKRFTVWIKSENTWTGSITPMFYLNGKLVETASTISSITTSWQEFNIDCPSSSVTEDGELAMKCDGEDFQVTNTLYFDDFSTTNI